MAFITAVFIFYISSLSFPPNFATGFYYTSIIYHAGIFFIFSFFLFLSGKFEIKFIFITLLIALLYASLDELHQLFVPGRAADIIDFAVDSVGIFFSLLASRFIKI